MSDRLNLVISPNPITHFGKITFNSAGGRTDIGIYDSLGRMIKNLYSGVMKSGEQTISIENENYKSGNYYVRVQQGDLQQTKLAQMISE